MAEYNEKDLKQRMNGALDALKREFAGLRTGRASASMLDPVQVEAYGAKMPLNQVATVNVPEPRLITVQVWDNSQVQAVEKAIRDSGLGLNPAVEGQVIRVPVPDLSEERRKELTKVAGKYTEEAKVSVRNVRRDGMEALKEMEKDKDISEDDHHRMADTVQKLTDDFVKQIDDLYHAKEKDILQV